MTVDTRQTRRMGEIKEIYRARLPELWRVAAAVSGSREAAPDLVQEAFVRAVQGANGFRGEGPLEGWLWRIVVNVSCNGRREPATAALPENLETEASSSTAVANGA